MNDSVYNYASILVRTHEYWMLSFTHEYDHEGLNINDELQCCNIHNKQITQQTLICRQNIDDLQLCKSTRTYESILLLSTHDLIVKD